MDGKLALKLGMFGGALYLAYTQGWLSMFGLGTASTTTTTAATTSTSGTSAGTVNTASSPVAASPASLDSLYSKMVAAAKAAGEASSLGVDAWGYYLNNSGITAPDPLPIFSAAVANFDRSQVFTAPQYWAIMAPALKTQLGLSGLGVYGGLGQLMRRYA